MSSATAAVDDRDQIRWVDNLPFWGVHVIAIAGIAWLGFSWSGVAIAAISYGVRLFAITAGYHRYFSHRAYKTSRPFQLVLAVMGLTATQKGPLWWAAHHRVHHKYSDQPQDVHSVRQRGFWWAHMFWILVKRNAGTDLDRVKDLAKFPELRFVDRHQIWFTVAFAVALYLVGGAHALVWGYFVSTVVLWHGTFTINSLSHVWGWRRYNTTDDSVNNPLMAILTLGEGWHNNHHYYQRSARQGFYWWEVDISFYILKLLEVAHVVWDVQGVPQHVRDHRPAAPVSADDIDAAVARAVTPGTTAS
ncbi:MAG: acyl-CoA desaturase [Deltaproteobacteria bacterium]|nr:acyl-CoA desaturase [Deltaproteobacteria bacterium]